MQQTLIWFQLMLAIAMAYHSPYLPYPIVSVCIIEYMSYRPGDRITFPTGYQQYQIKRPRSEKPSVSRVTTFDKVLYEAMHRPSVIEMASVHMEKLTLPPTLLLGNFAHNNLHTVKVSSGLNYQIASLNLRTNQLTNIDFLGSLVNLEIVDLQENRIYSLPGSTLRRLTKLKNLHLQRNSFESIPWNDLPCSLKHLDTLYSRVKTVQFINVSLPSLEYLNLRENRLSAINVTSLLLAAPKLKEVYLYNRQIDEFRMDAIKAELMANNISYAEIYVYRECYYDTNLVYVNGKCVELKDLPVSTGKAVLFTSMVIGVAALCVYILLVVLRNMN